MNILWFLNIHKGKLLYNVISYLVVHKLMGAESIFKIILQRCFYNFAIRKICVFLQSEIKSTCPDGGIGRRAGLKHQWIHFHAGSIPAPGTKKPLITYSK